MRDFRPVLNTNCRSSHTPHTAMRCGPVGPDGADPVVARLAQAFLGPLEGEEALALVGGQDPVAGHVRAGRHVDDSSTPMRGASRVANRPESG